MTERLVLKEALKRVTLDQDKTLAPEETVSRFRERLKKVDLDILRETVRIDNGRLDIPVYFSVCGEDAFAATGTRKQMGKGGTPAQAEASAVMELAERFSFFTFYREPANFVRARHRDLGSDALSLQEVARSVHDTSPEADAALALFAEYPQRWAHATNLAQARSVLVPFDWFFAINEFNGPCAGNCTEEAICQGICEIVERHTSSLVSRGHIRTPAIRLDSVTDPMTRGLIEKYRKAGIVLHVSDFTMETGIPTVGVLAYDPSTFPYASEIVWTAGTTPDPQKALSRALTETAQLAGDFNTGSTYVASGLPKFKHLDEAAFVRFPEKEVAISELPDLSHMDFKVEVQNLVTQLGRLQMQVLVVETTHPALGIPSFYTIAPGAHFRERALGTSVGMFLAKMITQQTEKDETIARLTEMDTALPGQYYLKFYLGTANLDQGRPHTALDLLKESLQWGPRREDIPSIYVYMAIGLKDLERYGEALAALEQAEKYDSERTDVYNLMGFCHFRLKEHEQAIACFEKVLRLDPGSAIDYANIASNYRDMGKTQEAIRYYELALSLDPTIDFARQNLERLRQ